MFSLILKNLISKFIPEKGKRIFFCVTVYSHLAARFSITVADKELLRLSEQLKFRLNGKTESKKVLSMRFPCFWSEVIWEAIPSPPLDVEKRTKFCETVLSSTPPWLKYNREEVMKNDLNRLLSLFYKEHEMVMMLKTATA